MEKVSKADYKLPHPVAMYKASQNQLTIMIGRTVAGVAAVVLPGRARRRQHQLVVDRRTLPRVVVDVAGRNRRRPGHTERRPEALRSPLAPLAIALVDQLQLTGRVYPPEASLARFVL